MLQLNAKRFDKRVIHRLASVLAQPQNFYRSLFTPSELECIRQINNVNAQDANRIIALHFEHNNIHSLFVSDANVSELMRETV